MERRVSAVEAELVSIRSSLYRQSQLLERLVHALAQSQRDDATISTTKGEAVEETRSDADYVDLEGKLSRFAAYDFMTWTPEQTVAWISNVLGHDTYAEQFSAVDGNMLYSMIFEHDHGLSLADKIFFMGVERDACVAMERAMGDLVK